MEEEEMLSDYEAATAIGSKILDAAERLKSINLITPGSIARYSFEIEDIRYNVAITIEPTA